MDDDSLETEDIAPQPASLSLARGTCIDRFILGKARWESGNHEAGRALATQALEAYAKAAGQRKSFEEVTAWLARHR